MSEPKAVTKLKSQIADTDFPHIYGQRALIKSAVRDAAKHVRDLAATVLASPSADGCDALIAATSDLKAILIYSTGDL